jgi:hypothetical protein
LIVLLVFAAFLSACAAERYLKTGETSSSGISGTYTLLLQGGREREHFFVICFAEGPVMMNFDFRYVEQFLVALALTSLTVLTHSVGMNWVRRYFRRSFSLAKDHGPLERNQLVMVGIVAIMMGTHCIEVLIWALFYMLRGVVPDRLSAIYFSVASYTTLGASNIKLPDHWRGIGGFEAMAAMLMFGWSTAVLAAVVVELHSLDT